MEQIVKKVVLITGATGGLGKLTAEALAKSGHQVFGTTRRAGAIGSVPLVTLDLTSETSVHACIEEVVGHAGRLDVVINNVGNLLIGAIEEHSFEEARILFESNFFGAARLIKAALPIMRARRSGTIINISSVGGLTGMPGSGYYAATKHALEGYTESLRYEVEPLGIGVCLVEPPVLRLGSSTLLQTRETIAAYASLRSARVKAISEEGNTGLDPAKVVAQIAGIVEHGARKMRYRVGAAASFVPVMKTLMPHRLFSGMMMRAMGLNNSSEEAKQP